MTQPVQRDRFPWWSKAAVVVAVVLFIGNQVATPLFGVYGYQADLKALSAHTQTLTQINQNTATLKTQAGELQAQNATLQKDLTAVETVVNYIHMIQTGPQQTVSREAATWELEEFRAICTSNPHCKNVPLPVDVAKELSGK